MDQEMADDRPRKVLSRAGLRHATEQDAEPEALAHSAKSEDNHQGLKLLLAIADSAPPNAVNFTDWGNGNASYRLRNTEAGHHALVCTNERPLRSATFCAAEFQISRQFGLRCTGDYLCRVSVAANTQLTGYWQRRQLGFTSSICDAPKFNGAHFVGAFALPALPRSVLAAIGASFE